MTTTAKMAEFGTFFGPSDGAGTIRAASAHHGGRALIRMRGLRRPCLEPRKPTPRP
jgi:hypothetical protein